jgi:hypothetical protein
MKRIYLTFIYILAGMCSPAWSDETASRVIDLEFTAAVESWVANAFGVRLPEPYQTLVDRLDADGYTDRAAAAKRLEMLVAAELSGSGQRWLLRARAIERRPECRYWLNRLLRDCERCSSCDALGYCSEYRPASVPADQPTYYGVPCQKCRRSEWQHGWQWIEGCRYGYLACEMCGGSGSFWNHRGLE